MPLPFANELTNLHSDRSHNWDGRTRGRAPHKPFLLLSILDGIEAGWIKGAHIKLDHDLTDTFFTYWNAVMGENRITTIALPFYHMQSESFWKLVYKPAKDVFNYSPSPGSLRDRIDFAELHRDLYDQLSNPGQTDKYRQLILSTYFDNETADKIRGLVSLNRSVYDYSETLIKQVAEPFVKYSITDEKQYKEGRIQYRDRGFRRAIREIYQDTCALCRSRVVTQNDESLIEGAHIIPWKENGTDDPRNGLALCGTHHWLFDRYMFTIDDNYRIKLSGWLKRGENDIAEMLNRDSKEILLPGEEQYYPALEALHEHRSKFREVNG